MRYIDAPVRRYKGSTLDGLRRGSGRPKRIWGEVIMHDMTNFQLIEDMTLDKRVWRSNIQRVSTGEPGRRSTCLPGNNKGKLVISSSLHRPPDISFYRVYCLSSHLSFLSKCQ
ncbi:hypothetical protein H5410_029978 [Solanum commersonii]|uniref:Uncharacterized protein n=1 Tax=Solanum commersonii TaxID=4109 RepID=A0A9J5YG57_SOLCO|nr:hypothetical protein H5410_029978 [Solanum commersonii]